VWLNQLRFNFEAFEDEFAGLDRKLIRAAKSLTGNEGSVKKAKKKKAKKQHGQVDPEIEKMSVEERNDLARSRQKYYDELWSRKFFPTEGPSCKNLAVIGNTDGNKLGQARDLEKRACGLDAIKQAGNDCLIVSLGSNNQWDFEVNAFEQLPCKIVTFDCTSTDSMPERIRSRTTFYKICIGQKDEVTGLGQYMTWQSMLRHIGHEAHPAILKIDIEGYEYGVIPAILSAPDAQQPQQILMEIHAETYDSKTLHLPGITWQDRVKTPSELVEFYREIYGAGYRFTYIDHDTVCNACREVVAVKIYCARLS
jgi:hypothetical protein